MIFGKGRGGLPFPVPLPFWAQFRGMNHGIDAWPWRAGHGRGGGHHIAAVLAGTDRDLRVPFYRILQRAGLHRGLIALLAVPFVGILAMLSVLAFSPWPNEPEGYR